MYSVFRQFLCKPGSSVTAILIFWISFSVSSCNSTPNPEESEEKLTAFFSAMTETSDDPGTDLEKLSTLYPDIKLLPAHLKSDTMEIIESHVEGTNVSVKVNSIWTSGAGKKQKNQIEFILGKGPGGQLSIVDSYGFCDYKAHEYYEFAYNTGCLDRNNVYSDLEMASALLKAQELFATLYEEFQLELKEKVTLKTWKWKKTLMGDLKITGVVENKTDVTIEGLKYEMTLKNKAGENLRTDEAALFTGSIPSGEKEFELKSPQSGKVDDLSFTLKFEEFYLKKSFREREFKGTECANR